MKKTIQAGIVPFLFAGLLGLASCGNHGVGQIDLSVIPKPQEVIPGKGVFTLGKSVDIRFDDQDQVAVEASGELGSFLQSSALPDQGRGSVKLKIDTNSELKPSGYRLEVKRGGIRITARDRAGLFYGMQTLRQLIPDDGSGRIPAMVVTDFPAFAWRGLMLDCSRTFLPKPYLLSYIDRLSAIKMNVLHLHLTDDQGWRLEIKKYPALTEVCSKFDPRFEGETDGFYTQDDIQEIVAYAAKKNITIVPEIEMPGHSQELFAAYPHFSCTGKKTYIFPFFKGPGITEEILCAGNDSVFSFMEDVLSEVIALFPSEYIHIGGDEAPKTAWKNCDVCQARIKAEGLANEEELQSYFIRRIGKFIHSQGRKMIGWDEILEGGLAENAAVMSWRGEKGGTEAARMGHPVVMSPTSHCYFDYSYENTSTEKVYSYEPVPSGLAATQASFILGAQANMWTHIARTEEAIDKQIFPRLYALAEVLWSNPEKRDYPDFERRLGRRLIPD